MQRRKASNCWEIVVSGKSTRDRMCVHPFLMDVSALCVGECVCLRFYVAVLEAH